MWRLRCGRRGSVGPAGRHRRPGAGAGAAARAARRGRRADHGPPGQVVDRDELVERLVAAGYRREYQVEARGEFAVRGSIVDVYPSTADHPVRIDLWGDEVDRLQTFAVADQRATGDLGPTCLPRSGESRSSPAGSCCPPRRSGPGPRSSSAPSRGAGPSGSACPRAMLFDGMESWLPWLTDDEHLLPDLLPDDALVLLVEPRQMRDRVRELNDEEASLADSLASTWGLPAQADGTPPELPRLSLPFDRLLRHTGADAWTVLGAPDRPDTPTSPAPPSRASTATRRPSPAGSGASSTAATASSSPPTAPARPNGSAGRWPTRASSPLLGSLTRPPHTSPSPAPGWWWHRSRRGSSCRPSSWWWSPRPTSPAGGGSTASPGAPGGARTSTTT